MATTEHELWDDYSISSAREYDIIECKPRSGWYISHFRWEKQMKKKCHWFHQRMENFFIKTTGPPHQQNASQRQEQKKPVNIQSIQREVQFSVQKTVNRMNITGHRYIPT